MEKFSVKRAELLLCRREYDELYRMACEGAYESGQPAAYAFMGYCAQYGKGCLKDPARAVGLYKKAIRFGQDHGTCMLADCYAEGVEVEKDENRAFSIMSAIAEKGLAYAEMRLGFYYSKGIGCEVDKAASFEWYMKAAEQDQPTAVKCVAVCYYTGTGTEKDRKKAYIWNCKGAELGNPWAFKSMASYYANGEDAAGIGRDPKKAVYWYRELLKSAIVTYDFEKDFIEEQIRKLEAEEVSPPGKQYIRQEPEPPVQTDSTGKEKSIKRILPGVMIDQLCSPAVFMLTNYNVNRQVIGFGSGFVIKEEGIALTCYHVLNQKDAVFAEAVFENNRKAPIISLIAFCEEEDWAVIKLSEGKYPVVPISTNYRRGEKVYAIGNPEGLTFTISEGLLSGTERNDGKRTMLQFSAPTSPGSSGGALLNEYGEAIGITSASIVKGQNLNLAVPIACVRMSMKGGPMSYDVFRRRLQ